MTQININFNNYINLESHEVITSKGESVGKKIEELKFKLHAFGDTQMILKEVKAFTIDQEAMAECIHLTKYFGPYQITKTTEDRFIFSKGQESALLSKSGW